MLSLVDELRNQGAEAAPISQPDMERFSPLGSAVKAIKEGYELQISLIQSASVIQVLAMTLLDREARVAANRFNGIVDKTERTIAATLAARHRLAAQFRYEFESDDGRPVVDFRDFERMVVEVAETECGDNYLPAFDGKAINGEQDIVAFAATMTALKSGAVLKVSVCQVTRGRWHPPVYVGKGEIGFSSDLLSPVEIVREIDHAVRAGRVDKDFSHELWSIRSLQRDPFAGYGLALCGYHAARSLDDVLRGAGKALFQIQERNLAAVLKAAA